MTQISNRNYSRSKILIVGKGKLRWVDYNLMTYISRPLSTYISGLLSVQEHFCDIFVSEKKIITRRLNVREETWGFVGKKP